MHSHLSRRQFLIAGGAAAAAGSVALSRPVRATGARLADDPFPRRFEHKFGSTTLPKVPTRIVTVGLTDHEALLAPWCGPARGDRVVRREALCHMAVGGRRPRRRYPGGARQPGDQLRGIAAHDPDLILGCYGGLEQLDYDRLAGIAPTIAQNSDYADWTTPWRTMAATIARAVGEDEAGAALIVAIDEQLSEIRATNPDFATATGITVDGPADGKFGFLSADDPRGRLLADLGFIFPPQLTELVASDLFYGEISAEQLPTLDSDVMVWLSYDADTQATAEADPLYPTLRAAREGRSVFLTEEETAAFGFSTVLSIPYLLDTFVAKLASAVDGDPET